MLLKLCMYFNLSNIHVETQNLVNVSSESSLLIMLNEKNKPLLNKPLGLFMLQKKTLVKVENLFTHFISICRRNVVMNQAEDFILLRATLSV